MLQNPSDAPVPTPRICAVMVTYDPDATLEENIRALLPEVDKLIVVDNGSQPAAHAMIAAAARDCEVIWNGTNLGLATALNVGIRAALADSDYAWVATFDDDSRVPPGFRHAMLEAYRACPYRDQVGIIGPRHVVLPCHPEAQPGDESGAPFAEEVVIMQSGCLVSAEALRKAGLFDDSFFIDYVDIEYCLRLRKHGLRIIQATQARLAHKLGEPARHSVLGKTTTVFHHSPVRRYYAARNRLWVYRKYLFSDPAWLCHDAWSWFKELVKLLLFEKDRARKLACVVQGAWDALWGRSGIYRRGPSPSP